MLVSAQRPCAEGQHDGSNKVKRETKDMKVYKFGGASVRNAEGAQPAQYHRRRTEPLHHRLGDGQDDQCAGTGVRGGAARRPRKIRCRDRTVARISRRDHRRPLARPDPSGTGRGVVRRTGSRRRRDAVPCGRRRVVVRHDRRLRRAALDDRRLRSTSPRREWPTIGSTCAVHWSRSSATRTLRSISTPRHSACWPKWKVRRRRSSWDRASSAARPTGRLRRSAARVRTTRRP